MKKAVLLTAVLAALLCSLFTGTYADGTDDVLSAIDALDNSLDKEPTDSSGAAEAEGSGVNGESEASSEGEAEADTTHTVESSSSVAESTGQLRSTKTRVSKRMKASRKQATHFNSMIHSVAMEETHMKKKKKKSPPRAPPVSSQGFYFCYRQNIWSHWDRAGMAHCGYPGSYLNGLYRNNKGMEYLSNVEELKCCFPKKQPAYGDCYDDDTIQKQWVEGVVRKEVMLEEDESMWEAPDVVPELPDKDMVAEEAKEVGSTNEDNMSSGRVGKRFAGKARSTPNKQMRLVSKQRAKSWTATGVITSSLTEDIAVMKKKKKKFPNPKDTGGWAQCKKPGYMMIGLEKGGNNTLDSLKKYRCCRPPNSETVYWRCYVENKVSSFDNKGWSNCRRPGHFLVGFFKTRRCNKLHCLELFKCCHPSYRAPRPTTKTFHSSTMQTPGTRVETGRFTFNIQRAYRVQAEKAGQFDAGLWTLSQGTHARKFFQRRIQFKRAFHKPPSVSITVQGYEDGDLLNHRFDVYLRRVDRTGFEFECQTWADAIVFSVTISYSAIGQDRLALEAQHKREQIIRDVVRKDGIYYKMWKKTEQVIKKAKDEAHKHHHWVKEDQLPKLYAARKEILQELARQSALVGEYYKYVEQIKRMFYRTWLRGLIYFKVLHCIIADVKRSIKKQDETKVWAEKTLKLMRARSMRAVVLLRKDMNKMWDEYDKMDKTLQYLVVKVKSKVTGNPMPFLEPIPDGMSGDKMDDQDRMLCECMHGAKSTSHADKSAAAQMEKSVRGQTLLEENEQESPGAEAGKGDHLIGELDIRPQGDQGYVSKTPPPSHKNLHLENSHLPPVREVPKQTGEGDGLPGEKPQRKCVCKRKRGNHTEKITLLM